MHSKHDFSQTSFDYVLDAHSALKFRKKVPIWGSQKMLILGFVVMEISQLVTSKVTTSLPVKIIYLENLLLASVDYTIKTVA